MSANLKICVPEATENYIQNPALRYDTTGWNAFGCTITRTLDQARFGIASLQVVTNGSVIREGCYYRVNTLAGINEPVTVSAYVRGGGRVHIRLIDNPNGKEWVSTACTLRSDRWQRISVSGFSTGSSDMRLYVETDGSVAKAITFYVDGAQMERKSYATTYCDGDQDGCRWNLVNHGSNSTRSGTTRAGGKWVPLAGPCRYNDDIYVTVVGGMGMPPLTNNSQSWALNAGSFYQNTKVLDRVITLSFNTKKVNKRLRGKPDISPLHNLRQELIELIKPDLTAGGEAFLFSYQEGDRELFIRLRYEAGLEGEWDLRNPWVNSFPIRFVANDPFFEEDSQEVKGLGFSSNFIINSSIAKINGTWNNLNYGTNSVIADYELGKKGEVYAATGTQANYNAAAIDPFRTVNYITYWDGTKWNALGTGANGVINDVGIAPNGDVYVTGAFTSIGGVAANRIAYWNGSAWNALGTGLAGGDGLQVSIAPDGTVYVGGTFTTAGGITARSIARWNGAWHGMGSASGFDTKVNSIAISRDGTTVYIGGSFIKNFGSGTNDLLRVCSYDPTTNLFTQVGVGFNATVLEVILSPSGKLYACGDFTASGTSTINHISLWNGTSWVALGSGMNGSVYSLDVASDEQIVAVGNFTQADGINVYTAALWNGGSWKNLDVAFGSGFCYSAQWTEDGDLYLGGTIGGASFSTRTTVTNPGTKETYPVIYVLGAGYLKWIENQTNQKRIYMDLTIQANEEIFFDIEQGTIMSTVRGDLTYTMLPGSDLHDFTLLPGENKIACFMPNDVNGKMQIRWTPQHWSADASPTPESLST